MSYSDFTLESLRRLFGITATDRPLFEPVDSFEPSAWLKESLQRGHDLALVSEKARGEFIVAPVLMNCREIVGRDFRIFSGIRLDVDAEKGLKGESDFVIARSDSSWALQSPLLVILEAKKNDIEEGLGQCAAQMLGATIYNAKDHKPVPYVYGCVTTGELWQFLKLDRQELLIHTELIPIQEIGKILWILVKCIQDLDRRTTTETAA